jgi:hypothetical protein
MTSLCNIDYLLFTRVIRDCFVHQSYIVLVLVFWVICIECCKLRRLAVTRRLVCVRSGEVSLLRGKHVENRYM